MAQTNLQEPFLGGERNNDLNWADLKLARASFAASCFAWPILAYRPFCKLCVRLVMRVKSWFVWCGRQVRAVVGVL